MACTTDADCPGNLVCYVNASWADGRTLCDCESLFYGWVGDSCTEFGPTTKFVLATGSIFLICAAFILLAAIKIVVEKYSLGIKWQWNASTEVFLGSVLVTVCFVCTQIAMISERIKPEEHQRIQIGGLKEKTNPSAIVVAILNAVTILIYVYTAANIGLSWIEISFVVDFASYSMIRRIRFFFKAIKVYVLLVTIISFTIPGLDGSTIILLMVIIPFFIAAFLIGKHKFVPTVKAANPELGFLVSRSANIFIFCLFFELLFFGISASLLSGEPRDFIEPGTLSPFMVLFQGLWLMVLISVAALNWYVYKISMQSFSKVRSSKQATIASSNQQVPNSKPTSSYVGTVNESRIDSNAGVESFI